MDVNENVFIDQMDKIKNTFQITTKFDFVIPDLNFKNWIENALNNPKNTKLEYILKNANRIVVLSDGAAHTNSVTPYLNDILYNHQPSPRSVIISNFEKFLNGKNKLNKQLILDLLLLKKYETLNPVSQFDFISFVNYDANIQNSLLISDENMWSLNPFSTNFSEYTSVIDDHHIHSQFLDIYSSIFIEKNVLDAIIINGLDAYDPSKRNAIFLGSSLFKPISGDMSKENFSRLQHMPNLRNEVQSTIKKLLAKFPDDEYNIIFKLHPVYSDETAIEYIKLITDNLIVNPIIISPNIPLETLIANDYYNFLSGNGQNFMFKQNYNYNTYEWTTFFGLQATTTTIHTTRLFYQTTFNLSAEDSSQLIPFSNFPIPIHFPVVDRIDNDSSSTKNYYQRNWETIMNIYAPFCPSITYNDDNLKNYDSIVLNFED